ncbi:hypothetical protein B4166_1844 [Caldibacillus thermoamylovorans]|uniref:Uncharacterized protein n=1 Tax=Caldibacillus thermoamylovorans TaxID=35841 RepID=A0ABD4A6W8_9BACI|nr:hypothetical protein B4166_1844 [Caldibacillus thermoamylovorans]KIO72603.1 hypothetical protein B4167_2905 [Caldibacillus thermoamylovorans]
MRLYRCFRGAFILLTVKVGKTSLSMMKVVLFAVEVRRKSEH